MLQNIPKTKQKILIIHNTFIRKLHCQLRLAYLHPHLFILRMHIQLTKFRASQLSYIDQCLGDGMLKEIMKFIEYTNP